MLVYIGYVAVHGICGTQAIINSQVRQFLSIPRMQITNLIILIDLWFVEVKQNMNIHIGSECFLYLGKVWQYVILSLVKTNRKQHSRYFEIQKK